VACLVFCSSPVHLRGSMPLGPVVPLGYRRALNLKFQFRKIHWSPPLGFHPLDLDLVCSSEKLYFSLNRRCRSSRSCLQSPGLGGGGVGQNSVPLTKKIIDLLLDQNCSSLKTMFSVLTYPRKMFQKYECTVKARR
jgi:hypothetical protein